MNKPFFVPSRMSSFIAMIRSPVPPAHPNCGRGRSAFPPTPLAVAFGATFGVSPHRFLKLRRLAMVRKLLRSRKGPAPLVKPVALAHGFWDLGQFALEYRAMYGEM